MAEDRAHRSERVIDFGAYKQSKERTGKGQRVSSTPDSPSLTKHEDEAMAVGNPTPPKRTLVSDVKKGISSATKFLGLQVEDN
jgi:hypothetical protein